MKRIVNGVTYNTATSTTLAQANWTCDEDEVSSVLYQTRGGAYFLDHAVTQSRWNEAEREHQTKVVHEFEPMSPDEAQTWILDGDVEIFHNPFGDPTEAEAEPEAGATIYIRLPASLKKAVDDAARGAGLSANVWAMRCLEQCLKAA